MNTGRIPDWTAQGFLPPNDPGDPTSFERSPYVVTIADFIRRFGTTLKRRAILMGLLAFREALHAAGLNHGFQWVDGSFLEDVETNYRRDPEDVDVVTFFKLPEKQSQESFALAHPALFNHDETKSQHNVDAYFVCLDDNLPEELVKQSAYWYSVWSHRRDSQWKGYVQIDLSPEDDLIARTELERIPFEGTMQ